MHLLRYCLLMTTLWCQDTVTVQQVTVVMI